MRVPWTARRSNQSVLKEISPEYSLEGVMLKLQYFGCLMRKADSLEEILGLGKIEGSKEKGTTKDDMVGWHHQISGYELSKLCVMVKDRKLWHAAVRWVTKSWT